MKHGVVMLFVVLFFFSLCMQAHAYDIVVAQDGSGDYTSIQAAIDAVPKSSAARTDIYIKSGRYDTEKLIIPADKQNVSLIGESRTETIISYHIYDCSAGHCPIEDAALWSDEIMRTSATLTISGDGFSAENLTLENTAGPVGQAQAITVRGDKAVFINCDIKSYQDTIYFWNEGKRAYLEGCLIVGRTNYIYGGGIVFFQDCEIRSWGGGWITAPSTPKDQKYGFVFNQCTLSYSTGSPRGGDDGMPVALGRPRHNYSKVTWECCEMTRMIDPLGWPTSLNMSYAATSVDLELYEYKNTGDGADMHGRANLAGIRTLTDAESLLYARQAVLAGDDGWDPVATNDGGEAAAAATLVNNGAGSSSGKTYYIDPEASSKGNGSYNSPFNDWTDVTWASGNSYLQKRGTTAYITSAIKINASNVFIGGYGSGAKPKIDGARYLGSSDWKDGGKNKWYASIPNRSHTTRFVFFGGVQNGKQGTLVGGTGYLNAKKKFYISYASSSDKLWVYSVGNPYDYYGGNVIIACAKSGFEATGKNYVTIQNIAVRNMNCYGISLYGCNNALVNSCTVSYCGGHVSSTGSTVGAGIVLWLGSINSRITSCTATQCWDYGVAIEHWRNPSHLGPYYTDIVSLDNNTVQNCGGGIQVAHMKTCINGSIKNVDVKNNSIEYCGSGWSGRTQNVGGSGIVCNAKKDKAKLDNIKIVGNKINGFYTKGISVMDGKNYTIAKNYIWNGKGTPKPNSSYVDSPALEIHGGGTGDSAGDVTGRIAYNLVYNNVGGKAIGLLVRNNTPGANLYIYNNAFYNNGNTSGNASFPNVFIQNSTKVDFKNNIVCSVSSLPAHYNRPYSTTFAAANNNCYFRSSGANFVKVNGRLYSTIGALRKDVKKETVSKKANPKFVDVSAKNFRLKYASPCRNAGSNGIRSVLHFTTDIVGNDNVNKPDIGAYEFH